MLIAIICGAYAMGLGWIPEALKVLEKYPASRFWGGGW
jgi:hypothetical protein